MGWHNPLVPWSELERALSGKPPLPGRGPADPAQHRHPGRSSRPRLPLKPEGPTSTDGTPRYIELHAHSSFSFLDGASSPEQLVAEALRLGLGGLALTDHDGLYGVVRFAEAAAGTGLRTLYGAELSLPGEEHLLVLARGQEGYRRLSVEISRGQMAGSKGAPVYDLDNVADAAGGHWLILTGCRKGALRQALSQGGPARAQQVLRELADRFDPANLAVELLVPAGPVDDERNYILAELAAAHQLPVVATTGAHYAQPDDARLAAAVAAVRARSDLAEYDPHLPAGPGAHLRSYHEMLRLFTYCPQAVHTAAELGAQCAFDLTLIAPGLPPYDLPPGADENSHLRILTLHGAADRFGTPQQNPQAYAQLDKELTLIAQLGFPGYFLVVHDIVDFCRRKNIFCQGRGSAANSAVCYALGITCVDAVRYGLLFERFLSPVREGAPDIDVDIESDRREEVIQYVYAKYGREYAAQVANVNTYRPKMAVRDMAKALGYAPGQQDAFSKELDSWIPLSRQPDTQIPDDVLTLASRLQDQPRHLAIHSGGMVICDRPIAQVCPVEWARKENRSVLQWDKDDCAAIGLVKFDLLGLGMLSALHYAVDLIADFDGTAIDLAKLDLEDAAVYQMLQRADSVGVFQVESRAQMATSPRLRPRTFYDLVVQVALIRPGPIQGDSVHPYIRRRNGEEPITYDHPVMERSLRKTLGIPLFQEQLMELAIDIAGFDAGEADQLRKAMGAKRSAAKMERLKTRLYDGMARLHQITGPTADRVYERLLAFANYGFAESHALSFAALVFQSAYLKLYYPAAFCAALLNAQPMGFYSPQSLVADARRHGVCVRGPDINASADTATLEAAADGKPAVRLGLSAIRGIGSECAKKIAIRRPAAGYTDLEQLTRTVTLTSAQAEALATAGALDVLTGANRRQALWAAGAAAGNRAGTLPGTVSGLDTPTLPGMSDAELVIADIWATGISPQRYPTEFSRPQLDTWGVISSSGLQQVEHGTRVLVAGMVTHRQRPATASGVIFINLEDETGMVNIICHATCWAKYRRVARTASALLVRGIVQRSGSGRVAAISVLADRMAPIEMVVAAPSRDFR